MATWTVYRKGTKLEFDSPYSNEEALKLAGLLKNDFAADLVGKAKKFGLSDKQWAWIHRLVWEADNPKAKVEKKVDASITVDAVVALFEHAHGSLKFPKLVFEINGQTVKMARVGSGKNAGCINLTDGKPYGENTWFGRINTDGSVTAGSALTEDVLALLKALDHAPKATIEKYGKASGNCVCCGLPLTQSAVIGYGEKCAANWNLPYDKAAVKAHAAKLAGVSEEAAEMVEDADWSAAKKATVETVVTEIATPVAVAEDDGEAF